MVKSPALAATSRDHTENDSLLASLSPQLPVFQDASVVPSTEGKRILKTLEALGRRYPLFRSVKSDNCLDAPCLFPPSVAGSFLKPIRLDCFEDDGDNFLAECVTHRKTPVNEIFLFDESRTFFPDDGPGCFFPLLVNWHWIAPWATAEVVQFLKALIKNNPSLLTLEKRNFLVKDFSWSGDNGQLRLMAVSDQDGEVSATELFYPRGQALLGHLIDGAAAAPWSVKSLDELPAAVLCRRSEHVERERVPTPIIPGGFFSFFMACPSNSGVSLSLEANS